MVALESIDLIKLVEIVLFLLNDITFLHIFVFNSIDGNSFDWGKKKFNIFIHENFSSPLKISYWIIWEKYKSMYNTRMKKKLIYLIK